MPRIPIEQKARYPFHFVYMNPQGANNARLPKLVAKAIRSQRHVSVQEAAKWCIENFGRARAGNSEMDYRWMERDSRFFFRYETDALMFRIRWC